MTSSDYPLGSIIVCTPLSAQANFADDKISSCADCSIKVRHRPYVPDYVVKICTSCAAKRVIREGDKMEMRVTQRTLEELALYYSKGTKQ